MPNLNRVILMGNLTRDPELRQTPSSQSVCNFGLAVNRHYTDGDGQKQQDTTFVDAEAWGRTAEVIDQYLAKGAPILVEGRLKQDQWQDRESGANRSKLKVVVESFEFISSGRNGNEQNPPSDQPKKAEPSRSANRQGGRRTQMAGAGR